MPNIEISKNYKFKISNIRFTVSIDHWRDLSENVSQPEIPTIRNSIHYHAVHELFFVDDTPITIHTPEGFEDYSSCIVCIPPFFKHYSYGTNRHRLLFSFERLDSRRTHISDFFESFFASENTFCANLNESINFYRKEFVRFFKNRNTLSDDMGSALLKLIFHSIFECNSTKNIIDGLPPSSDSYLIIIDNAINNFQNDVTLKSVADALYLSTKQTSRIIKKHYRKRFSDLLTEKRLEVARALLSEDKLSISEIVSKVNFSSESYFYFQFKKMFGMTPLEYKISTKKQ